MKQFLFVYQYDLITTKGIGNKILSADTIGEAVSKFISSHRHSIILNIIEL